MAEAVKRGGFYWSRHRPRYNLIIRNEAGEELVCDAHWGDKYHCTLSFAGRDSILAMYGHFDSERQAWFYWYNYKKQHPDRVEGWTPRVVQYEP